MLTYVLENLGKGVPVSSKYTIHFQTIRKNLVQDMFVRTWQPSSPQRKQLLKLQKQKTATLTAEFQALLLKQFELVLRDQAKQREVLQGMLRELLGEETTTVAEKLKDPDPWIRWVAIHAAAKKWMPLEQELIELLTDPYPAIRETARQALVRLSRGNDFGPLASAKQTQITQAQEQWQNWLDMQVAVREPKSYRRD